MLRDLQRFVTTFRELEQNDFGISREEEKVWNQLKEKLSKPTVSEKEDYHVMHRTIVIASLYPQAGASFLSGNYALSLAQKEIMTVLAEHPNKYSYFYFALDMEKRANDLADNLFFHRRRFQIKTGRVDPQVDQLSQVETAQWYFSVSKGSSTLVIDISSAWQDKFSQHVMDWADEVWFVFDTDLPRLARTISFEIPPEIWSKDRSKIRIIANKWNSSLERNSVIKRIEGTLSIWEKDERNCKIDWFVPCMDSEKVSMAHVDGKLYLEENPHEFDYFKNII